MLRTLLVLLGIALAALAGWALATVAGSTTAPPPPGPAATRDASSELVARVDALERENRALRDGLDDLARRIARPDAGTRAPLPAGPAPLPRAEDGSAPSDGQFGPQWYLEQYVRSFDGGGQGSEYFRLGVAAYAPELVLDLGAIVRDSRAVLALRVGLASLLGDSRLRGEGRAIDPLLVVLSVGQDEGLSGAALGSLGAIGTADTGVAIERICWDLEPQWISDEAMTLAIRLAAPDGNAAIERLLSSAPEVDQRMNLFDWMDRGDSDGALRVFRTSSFLDKPLRLTAAWWLGQSKSRPFRDFVDEWLGYELDEEVRAALGAARQDQLHIPPHEPLQLTGPPDSDPASDSQTAWASANSEMGVVWIETGYDPPLRANTVRIFEVLRAGAVSEVRVIDESGAQHTVWTGVDPTASPGVFDVTFPTTDFRVHGVRVFLDTDRVSGWNEVDAVELVGPEGRAWASEATASTSYAWR